MVYFYVPRTSKDYSYIVKNHYETYDIVMDVKTNFVNLTLDEALLQRQIICAKASLEVISNIIKGTVTYPELNLMSNIISLEAYKKQRENIIKECKFIIKYDRFSLEGEVEPEWEEVLNAFLEKNGEDAIERVFYYGFGFPTKIYEEINNALEAEPLE